MEQWAEIRRRVLTGEATKRDILRETGMHWTTLKKILMYATPPGYRQTVKRQKPKLGPHLKWICEVLAADKGLPKKQRHTAMRIWERLVQERGYTGSYTVVREAVREIRRTSGEVFMPLRHSPGEAQVDFFQALAKMGGVLRKVHVFCMALTYSDMFFVMAFPRECSEAFWEGHVRAFEFFGGVPRRISYDNLKIAVKAIVGCHERKLTDGFLQLASHYLFKYHFCTVRRANEKGVVEVMGKYARSHFMVPVPVVPDFGALNEGLREHCWNEQFRRLRGKGACKKELWKEERFLPLPEAEFDACRIQAGRANSLSLVRFQDNDYSVPVAYAHHELVVKGYVDQIVICSRDGKRIASHPRNWGREQVSYDPCHYLPLLDRKPGALDFAEPLFAFDLPECFDLLRRRLEHQKGHEGTKEYINVLRLLEKHPIERVRAAVKKTASLTYPSSDVVKMYCQPEEHPEVPVFHLDGREHLKSVKIFSPDLGSYQCLQERRA